jgi:hypothetical protein
VKAAAAYLWLVVVLAGAACHAAPREIPIEITGASEGIDPRRISDYAAAIDAIALMLVHKLNLSVPRDTLTIYALREEFEAGLIEHLGLDVLLARSTASFAQAAVGGRRVLVNDPEVARLGWPERIELIAHELVHTVQSELAGRRSVVRYQWLTEGFAEWAAYAVTEGLGLDDMARQRARIIALLREAGGSRVLPALAEMDTLAQWIAARRKYGYAATFSLSFLIVEYLMERHSYGAVLDYFRRFGESGDYAASFTLAFGERLETFEVELVPYLARLLD